MLLKLGRFFLLLDPTFHHLMFDILAHQLLLRFRDCHFEQFGELLLGATGFAGARGGD